MPVHSLPSHPSLEHLKYQALDLKKALVSGDRGAAQRMREFHPELKDAPDEAVFKAKLRLADFQLAIAREYGFKSWTRLKAHVEQPGLAERLRLPHHERIEDASFRKAVELLDEGDDAGLREYLRQHPMLVHQRVEFEGGNYFRNPTLLEFVAENPVRQGALPARIVEVAKVIVDAGADRAAINAALELVCTGRVPRECGVQLALIDILCDRGADPDAALEAAVAHGEFDAAEELIERGARITLPVAAALGRGKDAQKLIAAADEPTMRKALMLATQFGREEIVKLLLDAGAEVNGFGPIHSHSTPLHQAALRGDEGVVRLLLDHGADADLRDLLWNGTPADWARHAGHPEVERVLRKLGKNVRE